MNRWVGMVLLGLLGLLAGVSFGMARSGVPLVISSPTPRVQITAPAPPMPTTAPSPQRSATVNQLPKVTIDGDRLLEDLAAIEGERFLEADRAKTRQYLRQRLVRLGFQVKEQSFAQGVNLVARWPGITPRWVLGAHYDTVQGSPGADDNGTGVAALLALAEGYAGGKPPIEWVFFDQEEQGLLGSLAYVDRLRLTGELAAIRGAIVLDMIGSACYEPGCQRYPKGLAEALPKSIGKLPDRGDFIAVVGDAEHPELLQAFAAGADRSPGLVAVPVPFKGLMTPDLLRSDHSSFWLQNVGAVLVTDTANLRNPHYHRASDRLETVDPLFFAGVTQRLADAVGRLLSL
jgi:hypothetical protein